MSFVKFTKEISYGIHQMEGYLEMAKIEIAYENFLLLRNFQLKQVIHKN